MTIPPDKDEQPQDRVPPTGGESMDNAGPDSLDPDEITNSVSAGVVDEGAVTNEVSVPRTEPSQPHTFQQDDFAEQSEPEDESAYGEVIEAPIVELHTLVVKRDFEDLTLAELIGRFTRAPRQTWHLLVQVAQTPAYTRVSTPALVESDPPPPAAALKSGGRAAEQMALDADSAHGDHGVDVLARRRTSVQLGLYLTAFIIVWWGTNTLMNAPIRVESEALDRGAPFLLLGFIIWLAAEAYGDWPDLAAWWQRRRGEQLSPVEQDDPALHAADDADLSADRVPAFWAGIHPVRVFMALGGLLFAFIAYQRTAGNLFTTVGLLAWIVSIILWSAALASPMWSPAMVMRAWRHWLKGFQLRGNWTLAALGLIIVVGAVFRLADLQNLPPEMTSDHVEKLLDAARVLDGTTQVFFPNNGGREPVQMYAMALFSQLPGLGINFDSLKLLAVLEALLTLPVLWWMGREVIGERDQRLGNVVGLLLAALVAVSYWHTAITRLALRIVLTPLVTALLIIFLTRALRFNRRNDFIFSGLVLGFGLYTYQAVRMLPVVIVVGVAMAIVFKWRQTRSTRHQSPQTTRYLVNLAVLVVVSFVVFVPLFGYSIDASIGGPDHFWRRTFGRLLGDDVIQSTDDEGNIYYRNASLQERIDAFNKNLPVLMDNVRNALLMYNWKGDVAWINSAPNYPAMDTLTGALFIVGLAAWFARMVRQRDAMDWLLPLMLFIMLMPSALSIAYPVENPSATRTSGTLPEAYLFAALPLGLMVMSIKRASPRRMGAIFATGLMIMVLAGAFQINTWLYFTKYREAYLSPSLPYSMAGRILHGFAESDGSEGNAFMIAYPYWWDHRAIGLEAGIEGEWPNGILKASDVPRFLLEASQRPKPRYRFDPNKDILFFYSVDDKDAEELLGEWFPNGRAQRILTYQPEDDFMIYRVPFMGEQEFLDFAYNAAES